MKVENEWLKDVDEAGFTQAQRFREEIESPFRKIRLFLLPFLAASAGLGALVCGARLIAISSGVQGYETGETASNFGINLLGVLGFSALYWNDLRARDKDLVRIARSGKLSTLRVRVGTEGDAPATLPLKAFRKRFRMVIIGGGAEVVQLAQEMAGAGSEALTAAGAVVVPVLLPGLPPLPPADVAALRRAAGLPDAAAAAAGAGAEEVPAAWLPCLAEAVGEREWAEWMEAEARQVREQGKDPARGLAVCVERTGFIKQRLLGVPDWRGLAEESARRNKAAYGMPAFLTR